VISRSSGGWSVSWKELQNRESTNVTPHVVMRFMVGTNLTSLGCTDLEVTKNTHHGDTGFTEFHGTSEITASRAAGGCCHH
jgi:hypothetical protein